MNVFIDEMAMMIHRKSTRGRARLGMGCSSLDEVVSEQIDEIRRVLQWTTRVTYSRSVGPIPTVNMRHRLKLGEDEMPLVETWDIGSYVHSTMW